MTWARWRLNAAVRRGLPLLSLGVLTLTLAALRVAPVRPATLPTAREVIQRHVAAIGGEDAIMAIKSRYVWARYEYPARRLHGTLELYAARPNKRLLKIEYPDMGTEITGFDGKIGWKSKPGEPVQPVEGADLALLRDQSVFDFDLHPDSAFRSMTVMDSADFQGHHSYRLRLVSVTGRQWFEYYDVQTGLFVGNTFRQETERGPVTVVTVVSDYRPFDGVRLPTRLSIRAAYVEQVVTVVRVRNNQVDASVFDAPPKLRVGSSGRLE
jgi:hypothetical protein